MQTDTRPMTGGDIVVRFGALMFRNLIEAQNTGRADLVAAFEDEIERQESPIGYAIRSFIRAIHDARDLYGAQRVNVLTYSALDSRWSLCPIAGTGSRTH